MIDRDRQAIKCMEEDSTNRKQLMQPENMRGVSYYVKIMHQCPMFLYTLPFDVLKVCNIEL